MIYKVLVVDDSRIMRSELKKIIEKDPKLEVVGTAVNGSLAIEMVKELDPDVVTMDIYMPVMNGIDALKQIMKESPRPVIMISQYTQEGAEETIESLHCGAFDFIPKPAHSLGEEMADQAGIIRNKVKSAAINRNRIKPQKREWKPTPVKVATESIPASPDQMIGIGVSTGGPRTLLSILPQIPGTFTGSILIAQHMPEKFTASFAERLDSICYINAKEAEHGEIVSQGVIYIAPGGHHMRIHTRDNVSKIVIIDEIPELFYKPSVEQLFESMSENLGNQWLGVILTGMGGDGTKGLAKLRQDGGHTIAESEESCIVYGMPRKAIEMGAAEFILDEKEIANKLVELIG